MLKLNDELFAYVSEKAIVSPRRRMHYDLRTQAFEPMTSNGICEWLDTSMKMLNVMMKDTIIPVHRHNDTNEVVILLAGSGDEVEFLVDSFTGELVEVSRVHLEIGVCMGVVVGRAAWHTFIPTEDHTVIFEAKDGVYDPITTEDIWKKEDFNLSVENYISLKISK